MVIPEDYKLPMGNWTGLGCRVVGNCILVCNVKYKVIRHYFSKLIISFSLGMGRTV